MKKIILVIVSIGLLAVGCGKKVELKREVPSSPKESYEVLPR